MADTSSFHYKTKIDEKGFYEAWVVQDPRIRSQKHKDRKKALKEVRKYHLEVLEDEKHFDELIENHKNGIEGAVSK